MIVWLVACGLSSSSASSHGRQERRAARREEIASEVGRRPPSAPELTADEQGFDDLAPEVLSSVQRRRPRSAPQPAVSGGAMPMFVRPFDGFRASPWWFDHSTGEDEGKGQLAFTGVWVAGRNNHVAYDFLMPVGTPVYAAADGLVAKARDSGPQKCGKMKDAEKSLFVFLFHPDAPDGQHYATGYQHLSRIDVKEGTEVKAGQVIGLSGDTGCSTTPHLHFEVKRITNLEHLGGYAVDPYGWEGAEPDPKALRGRPSVNMWKPGEAPELRRFGDRGDRDSDSSSPLAVTKLLPLDAQNPVGGEFVDLGHRRSGSPTSLAGFTLTNAAGERVPLPDLTLRPGERLRVWTREPLRGLADQDDERPTREIGLNRQKQLWDDAGDCAMLLDPSGELVSYMPFGPATGARPECRSAPELEHE